jgi:hypothetical protein
MIVCHAGRDEDRIARADHSPFAVEFYLACAFEDEIKLLCDLVIVPLRPASCGNPRFRQVLLLTGAFVRSRMEPLGTNDIEGKAATGSGE